MVASEQRRVARVATRILRPPQHPEPTAPPAATAPPAEQAVCVECKWAAVQRCEDCFDEEEGPLYLCAKDACFDANHPERLRRKHRKSLVALSSKGKRPETCCPAHTSYPLELWCFQCSTFVCALCCLHGEHTGHEAPLVADAWKGIQEQLRETMKQVEEENAVSRERLGQLKKVQDGLASGNGAVGDARRALEEVKALFLAKVDALSGELDEVAAKWSAQAAADHEQLARHTRSVQSLVDDMRATCAQEKAEEARQVAIAYTELCAQRNALRASVPAVSVGVLDISTDALRQAVADLAAHAVVRVDLPAGFLCRLCGAFLPEHSVPCVACAEAVRAFEEGGGSLHSASTSLRANKAVVLAAVANSFFALLHASAELRADREVVIAAVAKDGEALQYASDELKADKDTVLTALATSADALAHASDELRGDKEVFFAALHAPAPFSSVLRHASEELRADEEVVLAAIAQDSSALGYASDVLRADRKVVLAALAKSGSALQHASYELRADKEVVRAAVAVSGGALQYASEDLKDNKEIVLRAVANSASALFSAGDDLKADRQVVRTAITQDGLMLRHAAESLQGDKQIVLAAVSMRGSSLQYASDWLRADKDVVLAAVKEHGNALRFADETLQDDKQILRKARRNGYGYW